MQLWHVLKIHAIHSYDKGQRDKYGRDECQKPHDVIHSVTHRPHIGVCKTPEDIPIGGERFGYLYDMVVQIPEIGLTTSLNEGVVVSLYTADNLTSWSDGFL